jgi:hypothetical protein
MRDLGKLSVVSFLTRLSRVQGFPICQQGFSTGCRAQVKTLWMVDIGYFECASVGIRRCSCPDRAYCYSRRRASGSTSRGNQETVCYIMDL